METGKASAAPNEKPAWLDVYDVSDCTNPELMSEVKWPENAHALRVSPNGRRVYGTNLSPFTGEGGLQVMDISSMAQPRFIGKLEATRPTGRPSSSRHMKSPSAPTSGASMPACGDLNQGFSISPPNREELGPEGGGIYIFDNSDIVENRPNPKLRLIGTVPHGGWHSVMPANIGGVPYLVGGSELTACPSTWPRISNIGDEKKPFIEGEFRLAMNRPENCPAMSPMEKATGGIVPAPGTAATTLTARPIPGWDCSTSCGLGFGRRSEESQQARRGCLFQAWRRLRRACPLHAEDRRYLVELRAEWLLCTRAHNPELRAELGLPRVLTAA